MNEVNNPSEIIDENGLNLSDLIQWGESNKSISNVPLLVLERASNLHKVLGIYTNKNDNGEINAIIIDSDYHQVDWWGL